MMGNRKNKRKGLSTVLLVFWATMIIVALTSGSCLSWKVQKGIQETTVVKPGEKKPASPEEAMQFLKSKLLKELLKPSINYKSYVTLPDPFIPFVKPPKKEETLATASVEELIPPEPFILTPLQKMDISEIQRGFKGTLWGPLGRKAIIEDPTGKGYIVEVGTPIGNKDGVVTAIFKDRLVIRQKVWDRKKHNFVFQEVVVKLQKGT